jgi:transcription elongation factor Elf1
MRMSTRVGLTEVQMAWSTTPLSLLNTYRVSHNLSTPAAFTSPLNQALLVNPGIGRQSPTMARRKDKRRVSREQLATNVRKHFNGAAVNEIDVVVELVYKSRNKGKRHSASCKLNIRLTPHRQGIPHALGAWNLQEDMIHACIEAR